MPKVDHERVERVLDRIGREPWDQRNWVAPARNACGSKMCYAGHGLADAGYKFRVADPVFPQVGTAGWFEKITLIGPDGETVTEAKNPGRYGEGSFGEQVMAEAAKVFGFTDRTADRVFIQTVRVTDLDQFRVEVERAIEDQELQDAEDL